MDKWINKIHCGDALELLRQLPDKCCDLCLTDPPYGIGMDKGFEGFGGFGKRIARRTYQNHGWDKQRPGCEYFSEILRVSKHCMIFGGNYFADLLPPSKHWVVWDKLNTMPSFGDCELIWTNFNRNSVKKITHLWNGLLGKEFERTHPTQKPVKLAGKLLKNYSKPTDIILDPFSGSGSFVIAAAKLNRRWIGIELNPEYVAMAEARIKRETAQMNMFHNVVRG